MQKIKYKELQRWRSDKYKSIWEVLYYDIIGISYDRLDICYSVTVTKNWWIIDMYSKNTRLSTFSKLIKRNEAILELKNLEQWKK